LFHKFCKTDELSQTFYYWKNVNQLFKYLVVQCFPLCISWLQSFLLCISWMTMLKSLSNIVIIRRMYGNQKLMEISNLLKVKPSWRWNPIGGKPMLGKSRRKTLGRLNNNETWVKPYKELTSPSIQNFKTLTLWVLFLICCLTYSFLLNTELDSLGFLTIYPLSTSPFHIATLALKWKPF